MQNIFMTTLFLSNGLIKSFEPDKKFNKIEAYRAHIRSYHHTVGSGVPCDK